MNKVLNTIMTLLLIYIAVISTVAILMMNKPSPKAPAPTLAVQPIEPEQIEVDDTGYSLSALAPMTVTIYHAVPSQTDSTPTITASGFDVAGLDIEELRICALSRDLLKRWGGDIDYGDSIYIDLPDDDLRGWWTVEDTMAKRWTNHIDLLVPVSRKGGKWNSINAFTVAP